MLARLYYRYIFLNDNPYARLIQSVLKGHRVQSQAEWDNEYSMGLWERLHDVSSQVHNAVLLSYIASRKPKSILEIGCGEGTLVPRLKQIGYDSYHGVDISEVAIRRCIQLADSKTSFSVANGDEYSPCGFFDVIVMNETVYYFSDPIGVVAKLLKSLNPGGAMALSVFETPQNLAVFRKIKNTFRIESESRIANRRGAWNVFLLTAPLDHLRES